MDRYVLESVLCESQRSTVHKATCVKTQKKVAVKIAGYDIENADIINELRHECIIHIHDFFQHELDYVTVMELGSVDLFTIVTNQILTHYQVEQAVFRMLSALDHIHSRVECVHCDVKLENFVLMDKYHFDTIKLIDFDYCCPKPEEGRYLYRKCGTAAYNSPEMLHGTYNETTDIWSLGVSLYAMVCNALLFSENTDSETFAHIVDFVTDYDNIPVLKNIKLNAILHDCLEFDFIRRKKAKTLLDKYFGHFF